MPPKLKAMPTLTEIVVESIIYNKTFFNQLYELENDLFEPVPCDIIEQIFDSYCELAYTKQTSASVNEDGVNANDICMLITKSTAKLNLSKLRAHRHNIDHSLICDALGTRCQNNLIELKLSRWIFSPSSLAFVTLLCGNIQNLDLSFSRATDEHIEIIAQNCPQLRHLNVQDEEQKITEKGLNQITDASFRLKSLNITGRKYALRYTLNLLVKQQSLTHLRICNLVEAIHLYAAKFGTQSLNLSHLVLLEVGSNVENLSLSQHLDFSLIVPCVSALEIDLSLFRRMIDRDSNYLFGLPTLTSLKELKVRETIGSAVSTRISQTWNTILALPSFWNITFLQLESGLQRVLFPDVSRQSNLNRLIIRNSIVEFTEEPSDEKSSSLVPQLPSKLSELIISKISSGLRFERLKEMLKQLSFVECLCLHFSRNAELIKTSKEWICCIAHILPHVKKLHISGNKNWEVNSDFLDYILQNSNRLIDLQINHMKIGATDRQQWLEHVSSTYEMKFKLLE